MCKKHSPRPSIKIVTKSFQELGNENSEKEEETLQASEDEAKRQAELQKERDSRQKEEAAYQVRLYLTQIQEMETEKKQRADRKRKLEQQCEDLDKKRQKSDEAEKLLRLE